MLKSKKQLESQPRKLRQLHKPQLSKQLLRRQRDKKLLREYRPLYSLLPKSWRRKVFIY